MDGSTPASPSVEMGANGVRRARPHSPAFEAWRRFRRHPLALASAAILLLMIAAIALGPTLWPVAINDIDFSARLKGPSWAHPFGTDDLGQDLLARMLYGGRISLAVGLAALGVANLGCTLLGAVARMLGGRHGARLTGV